MSVDRTLPSRELDAEVARAMTGRWWNVRPYQVFMSGAHHYIGDRRRDDGAWITASIPTYTTAPTYDSTYWGEMLEWLNAHADQFWLSYGDMEEPYIIVTYGGRARTFLGKTIGHALALAVLAVRDGMEEQS